MSAWNIISLKLILSIGVPSCNSSLLFKAISRVDLCRFGLEFSYFHSHRVLIGSS